MKAKFALFLITLFAASSPTQVFAHHSFAAEFDANSPIEVEGIVIKVEWTNPHTYFFIEVETEEEIRELIVKALNRMTDY